MAILEDTMSSPGKRMFDTVTMLRTGTANAGYSHKSPFLSNCFNIVGAATLIMIASPIFVVMTLLIWIREGRPIFYRGERMGRGKKSFEMYKFRTLVVNAEAQLTGELLGSRRELVTPTGQFLRDTRLDELPQLFNVLKRDMDLVGPRPVRPSVYEVKCREIRNYDRRFAVRPGLVGFSQIFTPHSAPKRMRALIDNRLIKHQESVLWNIKVLIYTGSLVMRSVVLRTIALLRTRVIRQFLLRRFQEKRRFDRFAASNTTCEIELDGVLVQMDELVDINTEAFLIRHHEDLEAKLPANFQLQVRIRRFGQSAWKTKRARCVGKLYRKTLREDGSYDYVIMYEPLSQFNAYIVHQYLLHESISG